MAVRNAISGEVIGHVVGPPEAVGTMTIGGRQHRVLRRDAEIVVSPVRDETADEAEDTPHSMAAGDGRYPKLSRRTCDVGAG